MFSDLEPYPRDGERTVKRPLIPDEILEDFAETHEEIVCVPEGAESLAELDLVSQTDPMNDDALQDVTDNAADLYRLLQREGVDS